jgi:hypothetical protein
MQNIKEIITRIILLIVIFATLMMLLYLFEKSPMDRKLNHTSSDTINQTATTTTTTSTSNLVMNQPDASSNVTNIKFIYRNSNYFKTTSSKTKF